ncbi:unnamed protein product [Cyprideis torosa]|uniref:Uncharacterized protein n=1 Tax=Cyprideis torosa TaxID=163714 RepID=A0A7R8WNE5_9CRUS|nr:unnamed protein product [Cyprideis torosa]CAG0903936.1 unnamed protein product [Cyprideis torosa]
MMNLGTNHGPMSLEKDIGLNFLNTSGKWTSNIFSSYGYPHRVYRLCYTLHDQEQYTQQDDHYLQFQADSKITEWNIYFTSGVAVNSNRFVHQCMDRCMKQQFVNGEAHTSILGTHCQFSGFQDVEGLEPCRNFEEADKALQTYTHLSVGISLETCKRKCPPSCTQLRYTFKNMKETLQANRTMAELHFSNPEEFRTIFVQQWSYSGLDMAADIGGYVGALLGISLLSVSHGITRRLRRMLQNQEQ